MLQQVLALHHGVVMHYISGVRCVIGPVGTHKISEPTRQALHHTALNAYLGAKPVFSLNLIMSLTIETFLEVPGNVYVFVAAVTTMLHPLLVKALN